ncbi:MAG: membrane lipoprotein lipid attachment site-containing protein [Candidatus Zixiibacteriota bacterium]
MKKMIFTLLLVFILFAGCKAEKQLEKPESSQEPKGTTIDIEPGMRLIYEFSMQGQPEELDIFIEAIEPEFTMKWNIPSRNSGHFYRVLLPEVIDSSIKERPRFYGGNDTLENEYSIIFPRNLYNDLMETDTCKFFPIGDNQKEATYLVKLGMEKVDVIIDGMNVQLDAIHARERIWKNYEYWILNNPEHPLILRRISTYDFKLKEIETD